MQLLPRPELRPQCEDADGARPGEPEQDGAVHAAAAERQQTSPFCEYGCIQFAEGCTLNIMVKMGLLPKQAGSPFSYFDKTATSAVASIVYTLLF